MNDTVKTEPANIDPTKQLLAKLGQRGPGQNPVDFIGELMDSELGQMIQEKEEDYKVQFDQIQAGLRYLKQQNDKLASAIARIDQKLVGLQR